MNPSAKQGSRPAALKFTLRRSSCPADCQVVDCSHPILFHSQGSPRDIEQSA